MTMHDPPLTSSFRRAMMLALGLTASTLAGVGGCADRGGFGVCVDEEVDYATCTQMLEPPPNGVPYTIREVCFDGSDGCDPCDADGITAAAIEQGSAACDKFEVSKVTLLCGPDPEEELECCYKVQLEGDFSCAIEGRPLLAGAESGPRLASLRSGTAWSAGREAFAALRRPNEPEVAEALRARWLRSARYEHASIAAFARVGLQLMSLGAPAALVRAAQRAMGDEIRHAQLCFELAARYGGSSVEAGPLRVEGSVTTGMNLEATLREAIFEGALNEGAAALEALERAHASEDPVVAEVLSRIAEDEQRHALLAYQTVQWALLAEPIRAREIVEACLGEGSAIQHEMWTEVVAPILTSLVARSRVAISA